MSVALNISGPASRLLSQVHAGLQPGALNQRVGGVAQRLVKRHLRAVNATRPNRLGGQCTNFYGKAAQATTFTTTGDGVVITIAKLGMRLRYFGGTVKAGVNISRHTGKPTVFLTIPAVAEAHGKRAGEFSNLKFAIVPGKGPALVKAEASTIKIGRPKKDGSRSVKQTGSVGGEVVFWLRRQVTFRPDPTVIPNAQDFNAAISADLNTWMNTLALRASVSAART